MAEPIAPIVVRLPIAAGPATPRGAITLPERVFPERADRPRELLSGEA